MSGQCLFAVKIKKKGSVKRNVSDLKQIINFNFKLNIFECRTLFVQTF